MISMTRFKSGCLILAAIVALTPDSAGAEMPEDPPQPSLQLGWNNLEEVLDDYVAEGLSGVIQVTRAGDTVLRRGFGTSNSELGARTRLDTIYGIGSTPIDFTVAGIFLLAQEDQLGLDDPIAMFIDGVPEDKTAITIRHLISGQSGLPDFHDLDSDWDPDLAWIDRHEAIRRIMSQALLFEPGTSREHSHSAYGLAAAIIELVSKQPYFEFLKEQVFVPAGMTRTGLYGDDGGFGLTDFAEGRGASSVGVPNCPPNWGPASWLVLGSGGMYSTLDDLRAFYRFVRVGGRLKQEYAKRWSTDGVGIGGSDRGFYVLRANQSDQDEVLLLVNGDGRSPEMQALSHALIELVMNPAKR